MTIKDVIRFVREQGLTCTWKIDTKEFRINLPRGSEDTAYYTNDGQDAKNTAVYMRTYFL